MRKLTPILIVLAACAVACEPSGPAASSNSAIPVEPGPTPDVSTGTSALVTPNCTPVPATGTGASAHDGNVPGNVIDDNLLTRWSNLGKGSWVQVDLGASKSLGALSVAWHRGSERANHFTVAVSPDNVTWTRVYAATSALNNDAQTYRFASAASARYLRLTVNGNTVNDWASVAEMRACASGGTTPVTPPATDSGPALPRQPYLQNVGTTTALVAFRTSVSCTPFVRYGLGTDISRTATATVAGWRHAVQLTGLTPGQVHSYVVEACGSTTGVRQFRAAPPATTQKVRFAAVGDFGTGGTLQAQVMAAINTDARRPELLLGLGDIAYDLGTEAEFQDHMFTPMASLLRRVPIFPAIGNHEFSTNYGQPYLDNLYLPANNPARSERYYSFDWGHVHFAAIDTSCWSSSTPDGCTRAVQKTWLANDLANTRQPWKVVFMHYPTWSSGSHGSTASIQRELVPILEQYGVDLVLAGHDHNYERTKPMKGAGVAPSGTRGVTYLVVGSGGASLRAFPGSQPSWSAYRNNSTGGYLDVTVDGGTLVAKQLTPAGATIDSVTLTKAITAAATSTTSASFSTSTSALKSDSSEPAVTAPGPKDDPDVMPEGWMRTTPLPEASRTNEGDERRPEDQTAAE